MFTNIACGQRRLLCGDSSAWLLAFSRRLAHSVRKRQSPTGGLHSGRGYGCEFRKLERVTRRTSPRSSRCAATRWSSATLGLCPCPQSVGSSVRRDGADTGFGDSASARFSARQWAGSNSPIAITPVSQACWVTVATGSPLIWITVEPRRQLVPWLEEHSVRESGSEEGTSRQSISGWTWIDRHRYTCRSRQSGTARR